MEFVDHLSDHIAGMAAVYGNSSQPFEKSVEGFPENSIFAHPVYLGPQFKGDEHHEGKIPVRRVGSSDHYELGDIGELALGTPTGNFKQKDGYPSNNGSHDRRIKNCIIQNAYLDKGCYGQSFVSMMFRK